MSERRMSDSKRCQLYCVNGIVVDLWDYDNERPTVRKVKQNWRFDYGHFDLVTDDDIRWIISAVAKYYD